MVVGNGMIDERRKQVLAAFHPATTYEERCLRIARAAEAMQKLLHKPYRITRTIPTEPTDTDVAMMAALKDLADLIDKWESVPWEALNNAFGNYFGEAWVDEGDPIDVIEKWLDTYAPKKADDA